MIKFYATKWCGDCHMARYVLEGKGVSFHEIDIDHDEEAAEFVKSVNRGYRSVPTIVFPDGSMLTEPSATELTAKLEEQGLA
jgi:mycoredoxin